jgi:hypothetical protein
LPAQPGDTVVDFNALLSLKDQHTITNAATEAYAGNHVAAERHRCYAGYDIGRLDDERMEGR